VAAASPTAGLEENVAGLLCYILGWVTGLIFLLIDKRPFVKFHAAQSIAMSIGVFVLYFVLAILWVCCMWYTLDFLPLCCIRCLGWRFSSSGYS